MPVPEALERIEREQEEIRISPSGNRTQPPLMRDWAADNERQTITHVSTGSQFRAYPVDTPMVDGLVTPFGPRYEVAVKFVGMTTVAQCPPMEEIRALGRQGIEWILKYIAESWRRIRRTSLPADADQP
jgi:hypothetical protein